MTIIDVHTHILPPEIIGQRDDYCQRDRWFGLLYGESRARLVGVEPLLSSMDRAGIDLSVVFGFAFADEGICRLCNQYVLALSRIYPERLLPFVVVNPCAGEQALRDARDGLERGARGIGELMPDGQGFALDDDDLLDPLLELARSADVPLLCHVNELVGHAYRGKGQQGPDAAYRLASRHSANRFILAHWGGGLPFYELMPEVRIGLRNVYYDTAASFYLYDEAIFRHVMAWAPSKVLFGTDYPLVGQKRFLERLRACGLDSDALDAVLGKNALAILNADPEPDLAPT